MRGGNPPPSPLGMSVFLLRGWMGWAEALPTFCPISQPKLGSPATTPPLSTAANPEVVHAIAGLLLSYLGGRS